MTKHMKCCAVNNDAQSAIEAESPDGLLSHGPYGLCQLRFGSGQAQEVARQAVRLLLLGTCDLQEPTNISGVLRSLTGRPEVCHCIAPHTHIRFHLSMCKKPVMTSLSLR